MNNNSKRDKNFFSRWRVTCYTKQDFSKQPLELWNYAKFTKPVFCPFLNHWINFGLWCKSSRPVRFDLCPTIPSVTVSFGQRHRWPMRVSTVLTLDRMDFDAFFQQVNLRYQWAIWVSPILTLDRMDFDMTFQQINLNTALICLFVPQQSFAFAYLSAILCMPCSWKIEIFSAMAKFSSLIRGDL